MVSLDEISNKLLMELFHGYLSNGGTPIFDLTEAMTEAGYNPHELGKHLVQRGWVKNQQYLPTGFSAAISWSGILQVGYDWWSSHSNQVISTIGINGNDWTGIMEILDMPSKDFQIAHDIGRALVDAGYAEWQPQHNEIYVKLTAEGMNYYNRNKPNFT